jgi:hypothetical protein
MHVNITVNMYICVFDVLRPVWCCVASGSGISNGGGGAEGNKKENTVCFFVSVKGETIPLSRLDSSVIVWMLIGLMGLPPRLIFKKLFPLGLTGGEEEEVFVVGTAFLKLACVAEVEVAVEDKLFIIFNRFSSSSFLSFFSSRTSDA